MSTRVLERAVPQGWPDTLVLDSAWRPGLDGEEVADLMVLPRPESPLRMSYEEFLEWADEDTLAEWVNGEVVMSSPAGNRHQDIAGFLDNIMRPFVEIHHLGVVRIPPFQMKLPYSGREPDLIFIAAEHLHRLLDNRLEGPGDLVVEIVSPESVVRDTEVKLREYEEAGVPEYWIINPLRRRFEAYVSDEDGRYQVAFDGEEGEYHAVHLPGFWLRVEWLWQRPMPSVTEVLREIGGETYARALVESGDEGFARLLIEQLRKHGFLP